MQIRFSLKDVFLLVLFSSLCVLFNPSLAFSDQTTSDNYCSERLFGSKSQNSCQKNCPAPSYACVKVSSYTASSYNNLDEDVDCYACKLLACKDFGHLDAVAKIGCDAKADMKSVPAAALPDGTPCWDCVAAEQCIKKFPGTSWLADCQKTCNQKDEKCVLAGVHDTKGCFKCVKNPPPPNTCADFGLLRFGQCNTCNPDQDCVPAGVKAQNGDQCFQCQNKGAPKEGDKAVSCEAAGFQSQPCQCGPNDYIHNFNQGDKNCCLCLKDECSPFYNLWDCLAGGKCEKEGGACRAMTRTKDGPGCYACDKPRIVEEPKNCQDLHLAESCDPFPCAKDEECQLINPLNRDGGFECAECVPAEIYNVCQHHPTHKHDSCAPCLQAHMGCEEIKAVDDPEIYCSKCVSPHDERCPDGEREGPCSDDVYCEGNTVCQNTANNCHTCVTPIKETQACPDNSFSDANCGGACADGSECEANEGGCFSCEPVEEQQEASCPEDSFGDATCGGGCDSNEACVPSSQAEVKKEESTTATSADDGYKLDVKYQFKPNFNLGLDYKYDDSCYVCAEKPQEKTGTQIGCDREKGMFMAGSHCNYQCKDNEVCGPASGDGGAWCEMCYPKTDAMRCAENIPGSTNDPDCENECSSSRCKKIPVFSIETQLNCYKCEEEPRDECYFAQRQKGPCGPSSCSIDQECDQVTISGQVCHWCQMKRSTTTSTPISALTSPETTNTCPMGQYISSDCYKQCTSMEECVSAASLKSSGFNMSQVISITPTDFYQKDCFVCAPKQKAENCPRYYEPGSCPGECYESEECLEKNGCYTCKPRGCPEGTFKDPDICYDCEEDGGYCEKVSTYRSILGYNLPCYYCNFDDPCPPGSVCNCSVCYSDNKLCVTSGGYDGYPCYNCVSKNAVKVVEYVVVVIETPRGRFVLDGEKPVDPSTVGGDFIPRSIMALAKLNGKIGDFRKQLGTIKSIASVFGKAKTINLGDLSSMLQGNLTKGPKFTENCFNKSLQAASAIANPPAKVGAASLNIGSPYGSDTSKDFVIDGPMVACGQTASGEDALKIFDASGRPIQTILRSELDSNPNKLFSTLLQAESGSQGVGNALEGGVDGIVNKFKSKLAAKISSFPVDKAESMVKGFKPGKEMPNDPLFFMEGKKKKKLFGILGSSMSAGDFNIGVGGAVGGSSAESNKLKVKDQWGLQRIGYLPKSDPDSAWNVVDGRVPNVVVAVIDSGLDFTHEDAPVNIWKNPRELDGNGKDDDGNGYVDDINGWNFLEDNNDLTDLKGHGTIVAGIIAANSNNAKGIAGINPGAIIMPLKVSNSDGENNSMNIYRAIYYAVDNGAKVINISLGNDGISQIEQSAINYAYLHGVPVFIASGNKGSYLPDVGPAAAKYAFAIGAMDYSGLRSTISSVGPGLLLLAPGEEIVSLRSQASFNHRSFAEGTEERYYVKQSGTSFSTPMVAATASLMLSNNPDLTPDQIGDVLVATADDMDDPGWDDMTGAGLLNATNALKGMKSEYLVVRIDGLTRELDSKEKYLGVNVFATVRGEFDSFTIGVDKGKRGGKFKQVAGPFTVPANNELVTMISKDDLRGSDEWVIQIEVKDKQGKAKTARALLDFNKLK